VDRVGDQGFVAAILPPAVDKTGSSERAFLWAAIYLADRTLCSMADVPTSLPPEALDHVHRLAFGYEGIPSSGFDDCGLYHRTDVPNRDPRTFDVTLDCEVCMRVKIVCIIESIQTLNASKDSESMRSFWSSCNAIAAALDVSQQTLSPLTLDKGFEALEYNRPFKINHHLLTPWILWCGATIALQHHLEGQGYPLAFQMAVGAAHKMAELVLPIRGTAADGSISLLYSDVCLMAYMYTACHVLIREMERLYKLGAKENEQRICMTNYSLQTIMDTLLGLSNVFPGWVSGANTLRDALLKSASQLWTLDSVHEEIARCPPLFP